MENKTPATLRDVLNYQAEDALTQDDIAWIRATFKDNPRGINILRRLFLPSMADCPVEDMLNDIWFKGGVDWASIPPDHAHQLIVSRQEVIKWIMNGLVQLKMHANTKEESTDSRLARLKKDSTK